MHLQPQYILTLQLELSRPEYGHMFAAVLDTNSGIMKVYVNGVEVGTQTTNGSMNIASTAPVFDWRVQHWWASHSMGVLTKLRFIAGR